MPIYQLHSAAGLLDKKCVDVPSDADAQLEAMKLAMEVKQRRPQGCLDGHWRVAITNDRDELLCTVVTIIVEARQSTAPLVNGSETS